MKAIRKCFLQSMHGNQYVPSVKMFVILQLCSEKFQLIISNVTSLTNAQNNCLDVDLVLSAEKFPSLVYRVSRLFKADWQWYDTHDTPFPSTIHVIFHMGAYNGSITHYGTKTGLPNNNQADLPLQTPYEINEMSITRTSSFQFKKNGRIKLVWWSIVELSN